MSMVLVIAGIDEARLIVDEISKYNMELAVAVTSRLGSNWLKQYGGVEVIKGRLTLERILKSIDDTGAVCLVDASSPSAKDISKNALLACKSKRIPYLRFESADNSCAEGEAIYVKDISEAVQKLEAIRGNILLTTGTAGLDAFSAVPDFRSRFYAWVFPESSSIARCERLGLNAGHIIALKGPFSEALYVQMLKHCNAAAMVAKDNGNAEANLDKIAAAKKSGVPLIMLERAVPQYGEKAAEVAEVLEFVQSIRKMIV